MFKAIVFPRTLSPGVVAGPRFETEVVIMSGGHESRNQVSSEPRREFDAAKACETEAQRADLISFFRVVRGMAYSFMLEDPSDYKVVTGEGVLRAIGDGTYQLQKRYTRDGQTSDADVTLPKQGTLVVKDGGVTLTEAVDYTVDYDTGIVTPLGGTPPEPDAWTGYFYVRCRFATDRIALVGETLQFFRTQSIPLIEVRVEE